MPQVSPSPHDHSADLAQHDPVWARIRKNALAIVEREPELATMIHTTVLNHATLEHAVAQRIAFRLGDGDVGATLLLQTFMEAIAVSDTFAAAIRADIVATADRDPACKRFIEPLLYFKGFHAVQTARLAHWLWHNDRRDMAFYLQSRSSAVFGVDIHPAARIGKGIMLDHATGIVVGETAAIGDDVSILHGVTLGGSGKEGGDRHPKVGSQVLIGAGASILGNITVGSCARVAAGSVVLEDVPSNKTVAGVPARVVGEAGCPDPARSMDHMLTALD